MTEEQYLPLGCGDWQETNFLGWGNFYILIGVLVCQVYTFVIPHGPVYLRYLCSSLSVIFPSIKKYWSKHTFILSRLGKLECRGSVTNRPSGERGCVPISDTVGPLFISLGPQCCPWIRVWTRRSSTALGPGLSEAQVAQGWSCRAPCSCQPLGVIAFSNPSLNPALNSLHQGLEQEGSL